MSAPDRSAARPFRKDDRINTVLTGAGVTTREDGTILYVRKGQAWVDNGPGNDPTGPYDAATGKWQGDDFGGFSRRIEHA